VFESEDIFFLSRMDCAVVPATLIVQLIVSLALPPEEQATTQDVPLPIPGSRDEWRRTPPVHNNQPPNYLAVRVGLNYARIAGLDTDGFHVPVMLHYQPTYLRITASRGARVLWQETLHYALPPELFPRAKIGRAWSLTTPEAVVGENGTLPRDLSEGLRHPMARMVESSVTPAEMAREPFTVDAANGTAVAFDGTAHMGIIMGVTKVVRDDTGEPLTFYLDRVWALTELIVFLSDERVDALYNA